MQISLGISERDIDTVRKLVRIVDEQCKYYEEKEDEDGLSDKEIMEFDDWLFRHNLFNRMEALIDNQIAVQEQLPGVNTPKMTLDDTRVLEEHFEMMNRRREHEKNMIAIRLEHLGSGV